MKKTILTAIIALGMGVFGSMAAAEDIAKFKGGIGVIPVSSAAGVANDNGTFPDVNRNVVRGVAPAGQIWVIEDLDAKVGIDGRIVVKGEGLLLGGGNNIGGNGNASVFATFFCGNLTFNSNLAGVPLDPDGDFRIDDILSPTPSSPCENPALLIRNASNLGWFAAGIPVR
jgi:hypothetical protein